MRSHESPGRVQRAWLALAAVLVAGALVWLVVREPHERSRASVDQEVERPPAKGAESSDLVLPAASTGVEPAGARSALGFEKSAVEPAAPAHDETGFFLRLVGKGDGRPLKDCQVSLHLFEELSEGDATLGQAFSSSDANGFVEVSELLSRHPEATQLLVYPEEDWRGAFEPERMPRAELLPGPGRAKRLELVRRPAVGLNGRAVDASGQPIPSLALRVEQWMEWMDSDRGIEEPSGPRARHVVSDQETEWIVTDGEGRFHGERDVPVGRLELRTLLDERCEVRLFPDGREVEARFDVGPVIQLDFSPPLSSMGRAPADFIAMLYRDPAEAGTEEEMSEPSSPWSLDRGAAPGRWFNSAPVFAGTPTSPPWTRLASTERAHPLPSFLVLLSRDGNAKGAARIDDLERHRRVPLHVEIEELGSVRGAVRFEREFESPDPPPASVPRRAECRASLRRVGSEALEEDLSARWLNGSVGTSIPFLFQAVPPGMYEIEFTTEGFSPETRTVSVPQVEPLDVLLSSTGGGGVHEVRGTLVTALGRALSRGLDGPCVPYVIVRSSALRLARTAPVDWNGNRGGFSLSLPPGEYRVSPNWERGGFPCEPRDALLVVPGPALELVLRDDLPAERFEIRLLDPPSDVAIEFSGYARLGEDYWSIYGERGPGMGVETLPGGEKRARLPFGPYAVGSRFALEIQAEGYRKLALDSAAFTAPFTANGPRAEPDGVRAAEVRLVRGWSVLINVVELVGEKRKLVPGIELALDGIPLPPTDEDGAVKFACDEKPAILTLRTPGWQLVEHHSWNDWGAVFANGEFTVEEGELDVFLRR